MINMSTSYQLKLIIILSIIIIIAGNCSHIKDLNNSELPSRIYTEFSYYPNGQKEYAANYLNGKLDGISHHWADDGSLISESAYSHGKLHGIWKKYYPNQNIMFEANYFHGQKHGKENWYYENGQIKSEHTFHYGIPENTIIRWHPDGSIIY